MSAPTICLAMIVKNEATVLERCLTSVRPYIARWVVCDTGSTDGTQQLVKDTLWDIPGQLHVHDWVDFSHNRNQSLCAAGKSACDYILVLDADEWVEVPDASALADLRADSYFLRTSSPTFSWLQQRLLRSALPWRYAGRLHEYLVCPEATGAELLPGLTLVTRHDGARSQDPEKHRKDIALMRAILADSPEDARIWFHLALTLRLDGQAEEARIALERRAEMEAGFPPERWYANYLLGHVHQQTGHAYLAPHHFLTAYADYPQTAEPLYWLGRYHLAQGEPELALPYLELAAAKRKPDMLFIREDSVYDWEACVWLARCMVALGRPEDANIILRDLIRRGTLPAGVLAPETESLIREHAGLEVA